MHVQKQVRRSIQILRPYVCTWLIKDNFLATVLALHNEGILSSSQYSFYCSTCDMSELVHKEACVPIVIEGSGRSVKYVAMNLHMSDSGPHNLSRATGDQCAHDINNEDEDSFLLSYVAKYCSYTADTKCISIAADCVWPGVHACAFCL